MKISVVIPAHNEEHYIAKTLSAVLAQDYSDFEVIVVDNNCTDRTAEIVRQFPAVKLVSEQQAGTQFARQKGVQTSTGDIVAFIDADCLPEPGWLSQAFKSFARGYVAVTGPYDYYDYSAMFSSVSFFVQKYIYYIFHIALQRLGVGGVFIAGNSVIGREALNKIGGLDTSFTFYGDDTDTVKRLTKIGSVHFDMNLVMKTSARRFKKQGIIKTFYLYVAHFLWVTFFKKPFPYGH